MKKWILTAGLLTLSTPALAQVSWNLSCSNEKLELLKINHTGTSSKNPLKITFVTADLKTMNVQESYSGKYKVTDEIGNLKQYAMDPGPTGEEVSLQVVPKKSFAGRCGRCNPPDDFPVSTYYAKLIVGNQVYDFVCK